ncbi:MFS transporter [Salinilacihabitans rarus]|uniref:MFS transporter n=1 Tax=Salinilacihabitans rarus TaxID=2961596 RepID=UPI0020C919A7|nr:MFS transporter [Salinilacihabitans rarus]
MGDDRDPPSVADAVTSFCEEYPDGERVIETVLEVDAEHDTWTFDDLSLDSGTFGELVSRGIVAKVDGEYRIASREGVRAGLADEPIAVEDAASSGVDLSFPVAFDPRAAAALAGALVFLFGMRILNYRSVFRDGRVVSPGNDPYHYRYWLEALLAESDGITDVAVVARMPEGAASRRPLTHASNWFLAELLGGDQWAAETIAAWLPVVGAVALGIVVYWLAVVVADDVRVGVASVVLLALAPVHAVYSGIGFLEHRLHQYFWLGVTLTTLAWLAVDLRRRRIARSATRRAIREHLRRPWTRVATVVLGVALAFSVLAWGGSILMLVPAAAYVGTKVALDVRADLPPAPANAPILVGLGLSAALTAFLHVRWGWHGAFVPRVSLLVALGAVAVVGLGELWRRREWPAAALVGLEPILVAGGLVAFRGLAPAEWARLSDRAVDLVAREDITETASLFGLDDAVVFGPVSQIGLSFYVALLVLGWACWATYRRYEPAWLLLSVYVVFWLALAAIQGRFAGQLTIPLSVLGGFGFVYLLAWAGLARKPAPFRSAGDGGAGRSATTRAVAANGGEPEPSIVVPRDRRTLFALVWIALLVCGVSLIYAPSLVGQTAHGDAEFGAATAIDEDADAVDREYPENFVLSVWGHNRMYNYFVSGEADDYEYAFDNFDAFRTGDDPDGWYEEFDRSDVGYVVLTEVEAEYPADSTQARLHDDLGAGGDGGEALEHYRAVYVDEEVTAFAVVPGATITAPGEPGETVPVETEVTVSGETIAYERDVTVGDDGRLEVTVPYPGNYSVGDREVRVSTAAVEDGSEVRLD